MFRRTLVIALMAASMGSITGPATAAVQVYLDTAPPALRVETVPAPRHGYVWVPGYWSAHKHKYVWVKGTWVRARPGYTYHSPRWVEHEGRWAMESGRWAHGDRDHDGVPNAVDHQPDNPRRY
jgi:hypothetical protein